MPSTVTRLAAAALATGALVAATGCAAGTTGGTGTAGGTSGSPAGSGVPAAGTAAPTGAVVLKFGLPTYPEALVDADGRALYTFSGDIHGNATCVGACAALWPPVLTTGDPVVTGGLADGGRQGRGDGSSQATYGGWPLYHYTGDTAPGQTNGLGRQSFGGTWTLILRNSNQVG